MKTILIIEDDESLSRGIAFAFQKDGYHVITADKIVTGNKAFFGK